MNNIIISNIVEEDYGTSATWKFVLVSPLLDVHTEVNNSMKNTWEVREEFRNMTLIPHRN